LQLAKKSAKNAHTPFDALAAFANLAELPKSWHAFRTHHPHFFPTLASGIKQQGFENVSSWLYASAEQWANLDPDTKGSCVPPLLFYRDRLRAVWTRNDPKADSLKFLLGFEKETNPARFGQMLMMPLIIPGQPLTPKEQTTVAGIPQGKPSVNGVTGEIEWEFTCELQQSLYELMKDRWRAKQCPNCGKYFVATKTAQVYCSTECYQEVKRKTSLDYWRREGSARRESKTKAKSKGKR
jgi:hypothetical protein